MPSAKNKPGDLTVTLGVARRDLLDLGLRNTLLNYRPLRAKGADVINETPREVFQLRVREEKHLTFLPGCVWQVHLAHFGSLIWPPRVARRESIRWRLCGGIEQSGEASSDGTSFKLRAIIRSGVFRE
jgi:hypothetical protein